MKIFTFMVSILMHIITIHYKTAIGNTAIKRSTALFESRTPSDWRAVWHEERHRKCYSDIAEHMNWVCSKDIYKASKRPFEENDHYESKSGRRKIKLKMRLQEVLKETEIPSELAGLLLPAEEAMSVVHQRSGYLERRRRKRNIMDECCSDNGCSWEEYAEYCPNTRRLRPRN